MSATPDSPASRLPAVYLSHGAPPLIDDTVDHFVLLFAALGASLESGADAATAIEGFWLGNSKRSIERR